ncbi:MAG: hypothetical protein MPN21_25855 [Thermoanaerobaculia bacterium]|nr:hypothetical protein [Thermoanaerobaculia bacterium]
MSTIWNVLGNACCDDGYRDSIMRRVKYGKLSMGDHEELYDFFHAQTPYSPTRWELVEINRVMSHAGGDEGPMAKISAVWGDSPRQESALRVVGLACVDDRFRQSLLSGTAEETRSALAKGPPGVSLTTGQVSALRDLLRRRSGDKTVTEWIQQVELVGWIPTWAPDCEPGATYSSTYSHANPLIISALQDVQPLKKYLASEPENRNDRVAMRAKVFELLRKDAASA